MNWTELKNGDVLVDNGTKGRNENYCVILILSPPRVGDRDNWCAFVSLVNGERRNESLINPYTDIEGEWDLVKP